MSDFHNLPRTRIGAGIVIVDLSDRILLVQPVYKTTWEIPGGIVEAGESPHKLIYRQKS